MKCPIHNMEMLIRNGGGDDYHTVIEFECPHPECHHWYMVASQRTLVEGWRKKPEPSREDNERVYRKEDKEELLSPLGTKMTKDRRKKYLEAPRRLSHYVKDEEGAVFKDEIKGDGQ